MKVEVVEESDGRLVLRLPGGDIGWAHLLCERLLAERAVSFAGATTDHPLLGNVLIKIIARNPRRELERALREIREALEEARQSLHAKQ